MYYLLMSIFEGKLKIEVAVASGVEAITKRELIKLGYQPSGANYGRITFEGDFFDVLRANIFLRTANRVRIMIAEFDAYTFDELYDEIYNIDWQNILPTDARVIVNAKSIKSDLFALSSIQSLSKKAIVNKMLDKFDLYSFSEQGSTYDFEISIIDNKVCVCLDTSGQGLHKRGYRTYLGDAPIKETLAAAMIQLSVWNPDRAFVDPFCGSGTIPIEASLIGLNIASGMMRNFSCEHFYGIPENARKKVQDEAEQLITRDKQLRISGFDINPSQIKLCQKHAENAGVSDKIHFQVQDMYDLSSRYAYGVIVTNPPYGERLMSERELRELYRNFGRVFNGLDNWCAYVITSFRDFEKYFYRRADRTRKLYNSELECRFYQYLGERPPKNIFVKEDE